ncbi:MAG: hypothetical protein ABI912_00510 [Actinomycetota bacterium]
MITRTQQLSYAPDDRPGSEHPTPRLDRIAPLSGVVFAVLAMAGYLTIGEFPDEQTPVSTLSTFYAAHHAQVGRGGVMLGYSVIFFIFFGATIWARIRRTAAAPVLAAAALLGAALTASDLMGASGYYATLGVIGGRPGTTPAALQAWHIAGATGNVSAGAIVLIVAVAAAALTARAFPLWLALSGLVLVALQFTPMSFLSWLLMHAWILVTSITMALRPIVQRPAATPGSVDRLSDASVAHG